MFLNHKGHKGHKGRRRWRRAVRAHKAHVRPEGPVGAWRASHAMLWFLEVLRWSPAGLIFHERPSVTLSPRRGVLFSVLRSLFSGARQRPLSARRRRAGGAGESGSLEAWMLGSLALHNGLPVARLRAFCSPFSVLRSPGRACAPLPLPGRGERLTSSNQLISRALWWSAHVFVEKTFSGARRRSGRGGRACGRRAGGWDGR